MGWQPQADPHGAPPPVPPMPAGAAEALAPPIAANADRSFTVSAWPSGHVAGADASAMGRRSVNRVSQVRQRYS